MKIILGSKRRHYVAIVDIFLLTVALIAGMVGCGQAAPPCTPTVAAGYAHTVGVKSDGTVGRRGL